VVERSPILAVQVNHSVDPVGTGHSGLLGLLVCLVGVLLVAWGVTPALRFRIWRASAVSAAAHVIESVPVVWRGDDVRWSPIVEFQADEKTILSLVNDSPSVDPWPLGELVEVLYDPDYPHAVRLANKRFSVSVGVVAGLGIIGLYLAATA
jgi:Protein of unknown function (DUF3592)